ncbi:MAG: hypothetical protein Q8L15_15800 [Methylobacter sp.]|nr:hypothetical protein [Methylobacter sp.]
MTFQEAMEKINNGIILACPVCFDGLEFDEKDQRMYCPKHGEYVSPNVKLTGRGPES